MIKKFKNCRMRTQFILVIAAAGVFSFMLFTFFWWNKWEMLNYIDKKFALASPFYQDPNPFWDVLVEEALKYDIPQSEDDKEAVEKLEPFFDLVADDYTGLYIYGAEDGLFRAGIYPQAMTNNTFRTLFDLGYRITGGEIEQRMDIRVEFRNGVAQVILVSYHNVRLLLPYCICLLILCIGFFLFVVLMFVHSKIKTIILLQKQVLQMAAGDLTQPFPPRGRDEIGILSKELDHLRVALGETIQKEQESRKANQDLITAMSHDLRTPLTILNGYLEILKLKKNPGLQEEYLKRCLQKTNDIKKITDSMFEYALVFEESETPELVEIPVSFLKQCIGENCDFIQLTGFEAKLDWDAGEGSLLGDETLLKRIFFNLFSNIMKYGDKKDVVKAAGHREDQTLVITLSNTIKQEPGKIESNHIGLKSVEKMTGLLHGTFTLQEDDKSFGIRLCFHLLP